jgi:F0F1-type ATP synthase delta subunit
METSDLYEKLIARLRLKSELNQVQLCLEEFLASFFAPKEHSEVMQLFDNLPNGISQIFKTTLLKEQITPANQGAVKKVVEKLQEKLATCKTIQITLAFQPDETAIELFSDWVKKNVDPGTLIDLQFDKTIVGGVLLVANGIYKDYSVRKALSNRFRIQKEEIMGLIS